MASPDELLAWTKAQFEGTAEPASHVDEDDDESYEEETVEADEIPDAQWDAFAQTLTRAQAQHAAADEDYALALYADWLADQQGDGEPAYAGPPMTGADTVAAVRAMERDGSLAESGWDSADAALAHMATPEGWQEAVAAGWPRDARPGVHEIGINARMHAWAAAMPGARIIPDPLKR